MRCEDNREVFHENLGSRKKQMRIGKKKQLNNLWSNRKKCLVNDKILFVVFEKDSSPDDVLEAARFSWERKKD